MKKIFSTKKVVLLIAVIFIFSSVLKSQDNRQDKADREDFYFSFQNFSSEVLNYTPRQREGVTNEKFNYGNLILNETKSAAKGDPGKLNAADFWNITTAFIVFKEPNKNLETAFQKAVADDSRSICAYVKATGASKLELLIPRTFLPFYDNCLQSSAAENKFNIEKYVQANKLDGELISGIYQVHLDDIKFRQSTPVDWSQQRPLDLKNQQMIDSLYGRYKTYLGKSLVGKEFDSVMWAVIQHSDVAMMEKYLPVIQQAVKDTEISPTLLKMLIDRISAINFGYQLYGSQLNVPLADEAQKREVLRKYEITLTEGN